MTTRAPLLALLAFALALSACGDSADAPEAPATLADDPTAAVAPDDPPAPEVHNSSLNQGDDTLESGEYLETYEVVAREGQWIRAQVVSGDFDPYLLVLSPTGVQTDIDDSAAGNTTMTKAVVEATEGGEWKIVVTIYAVGESGAYEISLEVLDEKPDDVDEGQQATPPATDDEPTVDV